MKVAVVSRYGSKNIGDELIVRELEELIQTYSNIKYRFDFNLNLYNSINEAFEKNKETSENRKTSGIAKKIYIKYIRKTFLVSKLRDYLNKRRALKNDQLNSYRNKLKDIDALIIGGGNAIYDTEKYSSSAFYFKLILREAKDLGIPIFVMNVGVGPFQTKKQLRETIETLDIANYITVRDKESFDLISELNVNGEKLFQTVDPVLFLQNMKNRQDNDISKIGICVMDIRLADYSEEQYYSYIQSLKSTICHLLENTQSRITVFCTEIKDLNALKDLESMLIGYKHTENLHFEKNSNLGNVMDVYKDIDLLLGTRMHSTIIAFSQEIPFVGINWQQKVKGFFKIINYNKNLLDIDEFIENHTKAIDTLSKAMKNYKLEREYLIKQKRELYSSYEINKELLKRVLEK